MAYELKVLPKQSLLTTLVQVLNPTYLQTLKILHLSYPDLLNEINNEVENNVMLEIKKNDELINFVRNHIFNKEATKKELLPQILPAEKSSLYEHLLFQLELEKLDPQSLSIGKTLLENIDERGFLSDYEKIKAEIVNNKTIKSKKIDQILSLIQTFEPEGVCARNLKECLIIQVKQFSLDEEIEKKLILIIKKHLEDLGEKKFAKIAEKFNLSEEAVKGINDFITEHLNPNPGGTFAKEAPQFVIPSFSWERINGEEKVLNLEATKGPLLILSNYYLKILENPQTDQKTHRFLKEKIEKAKNFLKNIVKRQQTLEQLIQKVCEKQAGFLSGNKKYLIPILQKDLAQTFNLHSSFVSRALSGKYIQTPAGVIPLKYLCSRSTQGRSISEIKFAIATIIKNEDKKKPLTDTQLQQVLEKQGISVARRTVAKYRKKLNLPTRKKRK